MILSDFNSKLFLSNASVNISRVVQKDMNLDKDPLEAKKNRLKSLSSLGEYKKKPLDGYV
jgi:hypothetical protein